MHCDTVSLLPLLLRHYLSDMLREGQRETMDSNTDEATQVLFINNVIILQRCYYTVQATSVLAKASILRTMGKFQMSF